jgi:hypothetical protein
MVKPAQAAGELHGERRIKPPTGLNCSSMERSSRQKSSQLSGRNGAIGVSDMHGNAARVAESEAGAERVNVTS